MWWARRVGARLTRGAAPQRPPLPSAAPLPDRRRADDIALGFDLPPFRHVQLRSHTQNGGGSVSQIQPLSSVRGTEACRSSNIDTK
mmetsp:Transcript_372/g.715  ORF Transcript_372/g.715 Transcript_372/m.715 type:complete len:86 (+) Transcript_372:70-327(+)